MKLTSIEYMQKKMNKKEKKYAPHALEARAAAISKSLDSGFFSLLNSPV